MVMLASNAKIILTLVFRLNIIRLAVGLEPAVAGGAVQIFEMSIMRATPKRVPLIDWNPSFQVFVSLRISGKTVTRAMLMKPPLVKGMIQDVNESTATKESRTSASIAPDMPKDAVQN